MASLRLENLDFRIESNASTNSLGALNSTSNSSCLVLLSFFGNTEFSSLSPLEIRFRYQPKEKRVTTASLSYLNTEEKSFYENVLELSSIFSREFL